MPLLPVVVLRPAPEVNQACFIFQLLRKIRLSPKSLILSGFIIEIRAKNNISQSQYFHYIKHILKDKKSKASR